MSDIDTYGNDPALMALSTMELNVGDDYLNTLKRACFSCSYFSNDNDLRRKRQNIVKLSDELFRYHHRGVCDPPSGRSLKEGIAT